MSRKKRVILAIIISLTVIGVGFGSFALYAYWPAVWNRDMPVLEFPVEDLDVIHVIQGYGDMPWGDFHNGIDFGCNESVNILAPCDLRVVGIKTWLYATDPDRWQTSVQFNINWVYRLSIAFESWALNETYAEIQRNAVNVKINQMVSQGEVLGELLYHGGGTHIHFMIRYKGEDVCPYNFFSQSAKDTFDNLWSICGFGGIPCNDTSIHL